MYSALLLFIASTKIRITIVNKTYYNNNNNNKTLYSLRIRGLYHKSNSKITTIQKDKI